MEVKLGKKTVTGIVAGDLVEVEVQLDADGRAWPDEEWLALFRADRDFPGDLEEPRLEHGKLRFEAREEELGRAWAALRARVSAANRLYSELSTPRPIADERTERNRRAGVKQRLEDAQSYLDALQ